jgi:hypothetical protein
MAYLKQTTARPVIVLRHRLIVWVIAAFAAVSMAAPTARTVRAESLQVNEGESIVIIGNTFAERMHLFGYFETFLHSKFPQHKLKIRNMGWSADELTLMPRPAGFGDMHQHLTQEEADIVFACFGMNEAFQGAAGIDGFGRDLDAFISDLAARQYNGRSAPRIVLVSPIAHEDLGDRMPDRRERNQILARYVQAMAAAAQRHKVTFVDLFAPTQAWMSSPSAAKLTFNGIHLTEYGDWVVSQMIARTLNLATSIAAPTGGGNAHAESLRRLVYEKNYYFFVRWRGPNLEYIVGQRNRMPGAKDLPKEMAEFDRIIADYDERIWSSAKPTPEQVWQRVPIGPPMWSKTPAYRETPGAITLETTDPPDDAALLGPRESLDKFTLPEGYEINLFASEIDFPIANPVAMNFDARGRLWVANTPTWPQPIPGDRPRDSIIILEDTNQDGTADKHTVFIDHLNMIHGFALGDGGAYIAQTPNVIFAKDADGDDRADEFRIVLHGFGSEDVEHSINNFKWHPDGALYFMEGIFFHTQVETPYGPRRVFDAGVFRYEPRSHRFDVFASWAFYDPWGQTFDDWGQSIILDASSGDYYNMSVISSNYVYPKVKPRKPELSFAPELVGISAGIDFLRNRHFPPESQGRFLGNQLVAFRGAHWYDIQENGTSYDLTRIEPTLLSSADPHFRPIAMTFGPDGALYIMDFYSRLIENTAFPKREPGRDHTHGRIWRITYEENALLKQPQIDGQSAAQLLPLFKEYETRTRNLARRELQQRDADEIIPALQKWLGALDTSNQLYEHHLLEALWIYQGLDVVEPDLLKKLLRSKNYRARAAAARVLRFWQNEMDGSIDLLATLVEDEHPRVRLEAVLACGYSASERAAEVALQAAAHPMDPGLRTVLDETMNYFERANTSR